MLGGCSSDRTPKNDGGPVQPAPEGARAALFNCSDGSVLNVRFENSQALVTTGGGNRLVLPQQVAGSGYWYSSGEHELRGKGGEATWTAGQRSPVQCKAVEKSS